MRSSNSSSSPESQPSALPSDSSAAQDREEPTGEPPRPDLLRRPGRPSTPPQEAFDRIARLAAHALRTPTALVLLAEADRPHVMGAVGLPDPPAGEERPPRLYALCEHVIDAGEPLTIEDAGTHDLTKGDPTLGDLTAVAGVPLWSPDGHALGALCVADLEPRAWSPQDEQALTDLAATLTRELGLRSTADQLAWERQAHAGTRSFTSAALDTLQDIFFLVDVEGHLLRWNRRVPEVTEYGEQELAEHVVTDFFVPGDRERVLHTIEQAVRKGTVQVEAVLLTRSGRTIPYEFTGSLLHDDAGAPLGVCGIGRNVEERQRMQHELQGHVHALEQANARFRGIVGSMPGVIYQCVKEPGGSISFPFVSSPATGEFALNLSVLMEHPERLADFIHPDDIGSLRAALEEDVQLPETWTWEGRALTADAAVRWVAVRSRPSRLRDGRVLWNGIVLDITEQRETEEALRLSEARHRGLIEANPDLFLRLSREGRYLDVQAPDAEELLVARPAELIGHTIPDFLPAPEAEQWLAIVAAALDSGRLQRHEYDLTTLDGTRHHFEARIVPVAADEVQAIVRDITDRQRYELGLVQAIEAAEEARARAEEAQAQAEEVARLKASLLTNMSHEIRTPLTSIIGFAEIIREEADEALGECAQHIGASGRRLLSTLNSVLDLAQIEARGYLLHPVEFDASLVACDTADLLRPQAREKGVDVHCVLPDQPAYLSTDKDAFARVVMNLVSNAVKFTEEGAVTVSAQPLPESDGIELRVQDTGVGIDADFLPRLFDEFRQESEGEARHFEGSGLGLSITQRLLEIMGGTIAVESRKGEGTTFTVRLPPTPPAGAVPDASPDADGGSL